MQRFLLKILALILSIILITGCEAKYEININSNETIDESIFIYENNNIVDKLTTSQENKIFEQILDFERGYEHYKRETYTTEKYSGYKYTYNFNYDEYDAMSQLRKCYDTLTFNSQSGLSIKTSNEFLCGSYYPDTSSIEISITSDYLILSSNADKIENNKSIWIINKDNYKNKPISITFDTNTINKENNKKNTPKMIVTFIIFITLIVFVIKNRKKYKI